MVNLPDLNPLWFVCSSGSRMAWLRFNIILLTTLSIILVKRFPLALIADLAKIIIVCYGKRLSSVHWSGLSRFIISSKSQYLRIWIHIRPDEL